MGIAAITRSHPCTVVVALTMLAVVGGQLAGALTGPAAASNANSAWTIQRVVLELDGQLIVDSQEEPTAFAHKAGSDFYLWHDGDPRAEVHLSCSSPLTGATVLNAAGDAEVEVTDAYLDLRNPQGKPAGCPIGNPDLVPGPLSGITLEKSAHETLLTDPEVGDEVSYSFTITNTGDDELANLSLTDDVHRYADGMTIGAYLDPGFDLEVLSSTPVTGDATTTLADVTLAPGGSVELEDASVHTITAEDIERGGVYNVATVTGNGTATGDPVIAENDKLVRITTTPPTQRPDPVVGPDTGADVEETVEVEPSIRIVKTVSDGVEFDDDGAAYVVVTGGASHDITYEYEITNDGDEDLTDLTLTDDKIGDLTDTLARAVSDGVLEVEESVTVTAVHEGVTADTFEDGLLINVGDVTATGTASGETATERDDERVFDVELLGEQPPAAPADPATGLAPSTPPPSAPTGQSPDGEVEVLGEVLNQPEADRSLPRTGLDSLHLSLLGLVLILLGGLTIRLSRSGQEQRVEVR